MPCCTSRGFSRLCVLWGFISLVALIVAFLNGSWVYIKEPINLPNSEITTSIKFRIGLWKACPTVKRVNSTIHIPSPPCTSIKYADYFALWKPSEVPNLGLWTTLEVTPVFIDKMRFATLLIGMSICFHIAGVLFAVLGHCYNDKKTLIAFALFLVGGLILALAVIAFASSISEAMQENGYAFGREPLQSPAYEYRYGWCFFTAGLVFITTKLTALLAFFGYLNRFSSVDEMVRQMVPGAERKLREHQRLTGDYLNKHTSVNQRQQYDAICPEIPKYEPECGPLLNKTPPDVCTTNKCGEFTAKDLSTTIDPPGGFGGPATFVPPPGSFTSASGNFNTANYTTTLAGQTVPITIKHHHSAHHPSPLAYSTNLPCNKYGTLPHPGTTVHQGFLGVSDLGSSSSNSSSSYCTKSKTLQPQRAKKKSVKIETFQVPETGFADFPKRNPGLAYSGSAV